MSLKFEKFTFCVIPHKDQRYEGTVGDYYEIPPAGWAFKASRLRPVKYSWLILAHEFIEWLICRLSGVKMKAIDKFDMAYEKARKAGEAKTPCGCKWREEPGDDIHAPYFHAHQCATLCEKAIVRELGIDWKAYEAAIEAL
ncbi:MAG: hypothetical protein ABSG46_18185 [Candidatus Binataceae bacterium]